MIKKSAYAEMKKTAERIDGIDRANAFDFGFAKAASDLGLTEAEYKQFYAAAVAKLQNQK